MKKRYLGLLALATVLTSGLAVVNEHGLEKVDAAAEYYVKVTEAPSDWTGNYLIVYETGNVAFDGNLETLDAVSNHTAVAITDGKIEATTAMKSSSFNVSAVESGYTLQSSSGYYIGHTKDENKLTADKTSALLNTISINDDDSVNIICSGGAYLRFNAGSVAQSGDRFRYYKSSSYTNQKAIQLYKYEGEGSTEVTNSQLLTSTVDNYFNEGVYTKKTQIDLKYESKEEIAEYFHGSVQSDRTTYYNGTELLMANFDGTVRGVDSETGINSGYGTVTEDNLAEVTTQIKNAKVGDMTHFTLNKDGKTKTYDYVVPKGAHTNWIDKSKDGMEGFYVTLEDMTKEGYFEGWESNTYAVTNSNDKFLKDFLAFTAPCLESTVLGTKYITVEGITLKVEDKKDYLSLQIILESTNSGQVNNDSCILSEARVYTGEVKQEVSKTYSLVVDGKTVELTENNGVWSANGVLIGAEKEYHVVNNFGWGYCVTTNDIAAKYDVSFDTSDYSFIKEKSKYSITIEEAENGTITTEADLDSEFAYGTQVKFTIVPDDTFVCKSVTVSGSAISAEDITANTFTITVDENETIVATFESETTATKSIEFNLGSNGSATHKDGSEKETYSETVSGYTLSITGGSKMYTGAIDAKGNSCLKFGTSSAVGGMEFTVPADVTRVIIHVGKYKSNTTKVSINGTTYTLTKNSNDGAYDAIEVDTSTEKKVSFTTVSGGLRCMLNSIVFITE